MTFAHWCTAYVEMLARDESRLQDALKRLDVSPLGCGALAERPMKSTVNS